MNAKQWYQRRVAITAGVVTLVNPALDWDHFPALADALLQEWELATLERECGADRHSWLLEFEGSRFRLEYEHYSGCWLAAEQPADAEALLWLARLHQG